MEFLIAAVKISIVIGLFVGMNHAHKKGYDRPTRIENGRLSRKSVI